MKAVDVDTLLAENELELTLSGRKFKIKDVSMSTFMETARSDVKKGKGKERDKDLLHKQLASFLGVDIQEVRKVGLKATGLALNAIREWLTDSNPDAEPEEPVDRFDKKTGKPLKTGGAKPPKNP